jgi:hypothetical protein
MGFLLGIKMMSIKIQSFSSCWVGGEVNGNFINPFKDLNVYQPFSFTTEDCPIVILGDRELGFVDTIKNKKIVGWLGGEPRVVVPEAYDFAEKNIDKFELIFTFDEQLLKLNKKFRFCPFGTSSFSELGDRSIKAKNKNLSIIGNVRYCRFPGHFLREAVITKWKNKFDTIKHGGIFEDKRQYLNDYRYSVIIENSKQNHYFSEKLIDCLLVGTIPIYWGCDSIFSFGFDRRGFFVFNDENDLEEIFNNISEEDYISKLDYVIYNHKVAEKYLQCNQASWLWENGR